MKALRILLVLVVVLAVLFVVGDRIAVRVADNAAAEKLQTSQHLSTKPTVKINGFPFLTQALSRKLNSVHVSATDVTIERDGRKVHVSQLDAQLSDVTASKDLSNGTVGSGTGAARFSYADLKALSNVDLSYGGGDKVKATKSVTVLGQTVSATVTASVAVGAGNVLSFTSPTVSAGGVTLPESVSAALVGLLSQPVRLGTLPVGLTVRGVTAAADGVRVELSAKNVPLR